MRAQVVYRYILLQLHYQACTIVVEVVDVVPKQQQYALQRRDVVLSKYLLLFEELSDCAPAGRQAGCVAASRIINDFAGTAPPHALCRITQLLILTYLLTSSQPASQQATNYYYYFLSFGLTIFIVCVSFLPLRGSLISSPCIRPKKIKGGRRKTIY